MTVADTSLMAYHRVVALGITADQQLLILKALAKAGEPLTRSELSVKSGVKLSSVCGAVNALVKDGHLIELDWRTCRETGYQAHPLALAFAPFLALQPVDERDAQAVPPDHRQLPLL